MIASSRKKTDRRDAWWIAKALAAGITPHPVYIPDAQVRLVRSLLSRRNAIANERRRWQMRARSYLWAAGFRLPRVRRSVDWLLQWALDQELEVDAHLDDAFQLCGRQHKEPGLELKSIDAQFRRLTKDLPEIRRLQTIPAVGTKVAIAIYAWVGDVSRFRNARLLCSYAGLVPCVHQSGETDRTAGITKEGAKPLRSILVQAGHVLLFRCDSAAAGARLPCALASACPQHAGSHSGALDVPDTDLPEAHLRHDVLETLARRRADPGAAPEVDVNDPHFLEAEQASTLLHSVLQALALDVLAHLDVRRLSQIDYRFAHKVLRSNLVIDALVHCHLLPLFGLRRSLAPSTR
jgi:hypothetical protein